MGKFGGSCKNNRAKGKSCDPISTQVPERVSVGEREPQFYQREKTDESRREARETKSKTSWGGKRKIPNVENFKRVVSGVKGHQRSHIDKAAEEIDGLLSSFALLVHTPKHCGTRSRADYQNELNCPLLAPLVCKDGAVRGSDVQPELAPRMLEAAKEEL